MKTKYHQSKNAHKRWTDLERDYVMDSWGELSIRGIAITLKRTEGSIIRFAEKNGLGGSTIKNQLYLSTTEASEMISVDPTTIIAWIKSNQLPVKKGIIKQRKVYRIDVLDFLDFLRANPSKWKAQERHLDMFHVEDEYWIRKKIIADSVSPRRRELWTTKEEARLKELVAEGKTSREISEIMGRSLAGIKRKRNRLCNQKEIK